ncbi:hypothetical protein ACIQVE_21285 [Pseudomonas sp. NPDC098747]|uniref:hypothetical protein n=1 Tax=Pseudomonas sp. NPDC098747 TaxID=3364487 RepID=UPI00383BB68C
MATSYADNRQQEELDERLRNPVARCSRCGLNPHNFDNAEFADAHTARLAERNARQQAKQKENAKRIRAAVDQIAEFWSRKEKSNVPKP